MPFPMVHLTIAHRLRNMLSEKDYGMYYLGTLAPDAYKTRQGEPRSRREATHCANDNIAQWRANVGELMQNHKSVPASFAFGYAMHLYVDVLWRESIEDRFRALYRMGGRNPAVERQAYVWDMSAFDLVLYRDSSIKDDVWPLLAETEAIGWDGYVTAQDVAKERDRTLEWYEPRLACINPMMYITKQELLLFLDAAVHDARLRMQA